MRFDQRQMMLLNQSVISPAVVSQTPGCDRMYSSRGAKHAYAMWLADPVRVQRDAHHAALFGAFFVDVSK